MTLIPIVALVLVVASVALRIRRPGFRWLGLPRLGFRRATAPRPDSQRTDARHPNVQQPNAPQPAPRASTLCWASLPTLPLALVAAWCTLGLYEGGPAELVALAAASLLAHGIALDRDGLRARLDAWARDRGVALPLAHALLAAVAVIACCALGLLALELPYNAGALGIAPRFALIEGALILLVLLALFFLTQRSGAGLVLGVAACWLIGLAQFFVAAFKGTAILPNDLFALGTAAAVSGSYVYAVDGQVLLGLACVALSGGVASLTSGASAPKGVPAPKSAAVPEGAPAPGGAPRAKSTPAACARRVCGNLAGSALAAGALVLLVTVPSFTGALGVGMDYWFTLDFYRRQGMLTTFVAIAQDMRINVPEGYDASDARALEAELARTYDETLGATPAREAARRQFAESAPSVVCVMNETFSDLSAFRGETWGYAGTTALDGLPGTLARGRANVSVLGGGTCNSEFEFLTGVPLAYVGDGKYPYQIYDLAGTPSLARQLSELGYDTTAIHPNLASNWSRDEVYRTMGFDRFLSIDDFAGAPTFHSGVTDAATYDKVLELLRSEDAPQFIFDVTMQNHSAYDQGNIAPELLGGYSVDGFGAYDNGQLNEYLACIAASERDLADFIAALGELDRPVVLVFFGDHQPYLSTALNGTLFPEEDPASIEHNVRTHQTEYLVWANYDVSGQGDPVEADTSLPFLAASTLHAVGAPLTDFQRASLVAREEMPSLSLVGVQDAAGAWHPLDAAGGLPARFDELARVTYLEFASKVE